MEATDQTPPEQQHRPRRSQRLLWVLGGLVAVALLVGALVGALRSPAELDPDSPEGVVQAYLEAVIEGDHAAAAGYLSEETARRCRASAFRQAWVPDGLTADLDGVRVRGPRTEVRVRMRTTADPFTLDGYTSTETFTLADENGAWRLVDDPWPLYACPTP
ncbi:MAG TPA: hypothetical protein VK891_16020 [Euzebyales bacterium]|nr:hypothetical protein [Euzebyales bacterium]